MIDQPPPPLVLDCKGAPAAIDLAIDRWYNATVIERAYIMGQVGQYPTMRTWLAACVQWLVDRQQPIDDAGGLTAYMTR